MADEKQSLATANNAHYEMKGWDIIACTSQKTMNGILKYLPPTHVKDKIPFPAFGLKMEADVDVMLGCPQLKVKSMSGRKVEVWFEMTGSVTMNQVKTSFPLHPNDPTVYLIATISLTQVESTIQEEKKDKTKYDLCIHFKSKDFIVDLQLAGVEPGTLAALTVLCTNMLRDYIGDHKDYYVASFDLEDSQSLQPFIPHLCDYTFVLNEQNRDASQLLVLMLTVSTARGQIDFEKTLDFPADAPFCVLMSNHLLITYAVYPGLKSKILSECKHPDQAEKKLAIPPRSTFPLYMIGNFGGKMWLNKDHDPWIQTINCYVDTTKQQLFFHLDVRCDATFLHIHLDTWDKVWFKLVCSDGKMQFQKASEVSDKSSHLEWWKWLLAALFSWIALIVVAIIDGIASDKNPTISGSFNDVPAHVVQWPRQKLLEVKEVQLPGNVIVFLDVHL